MRQNKTRKNSPILSDKNKKARSIEAPNIKLTSALPSAKLTPPIQGVFLDNFSSPTPRSFTDPPPQGTSAASLPSALKSSIENLSGFAMDEVAVHYNSPKPQGLGAAAYAQGNEIHLGPGNEKHLPHEAWHIVQQKQGRVQARFQMKHAAINDDISLEREADRMGAKALAGNTAPKRESLKSQKDSAAQAPYQMQFDKETSYGLEIEFKNRMVSPYDYSKSMTEVPITKVPELKDWKAGTDRGRPTKPHQDLSTVLEYESAVYMGLDWQNGTVDKAITAAMNSGIIAQVIQEIRTANDMSKEKTALTDTSQSDHLGTVENQKRQVSENKEEPSATMQVTTLGRRSDQHMDALNLVSDDITDLSTVIGKAKGYSDTLMDAIKGAKTESRAINADLKKHADPHIIGSPAGALIMEDLTAITSVLVQSIAFSEAAIGGGAGTPKNLVDPLPRRIIGPPVAGFQQALGIPKGVYDTYLKGFQGRIEKTDEANLGTLFSTVLATFAWFAQGSVKSNDTLTNVQDSSVSSGIDAWTIDEIMANILSAPPKKGVPSLWHDIAGSDPTLENEIIANAKKIKPTEWTSHEIRNMLFALGMDVKEMLQFSELMKKHVST